MSPADASSGRALPEALREGQSLTLHIGVLVQPYRSRSKGVGATTTGDVAEILEGKYGLFSAFACVAEKDIASAVENGLQGAVEALLTGHAVDPWGSAAQAIQQRFRNFISSGESERSGIPGTPTAAALRGVNHRLKHPYRKSNPRRPSFRDTGLLMSSGRVWID